MNSKHLLVSASIVLAIPFCANAQEILVKGAVLESGTRNRIALAEITNKRNHYVVGSNDLGLFEIKAAVGDTLVFVKRDFSDREVVVGSTSSITVQLTRTTLDQVDIMGQNKKQEMNAIRRDFRNQGSFYAGKPPLLSYIFTPLTALYELFGKTPKNARRFNKYVGTELQQGEIDALFNESKIKKETNLQGADLEDFMLNYRPEYQQAQKWTDYDAVKYIRDSYKKYTDTLRKKP
ncbi:MAG: hypothetical protein EOO20_13020 [Chryseobacterium sp.]|nr:MAG: hypothetical protein EOO20_13020 [Chryseobacterium sp.]